MILLPDEYIATYVTTSGHLGDQVSQPTISAGTAAVTGELYVGGWKEQFDDTPIPGDPFVQPKKGAVVYDLLPLLLEGDLGRLASLPSGATVVWPLIAGISNDPVLWQDGCGRLTADRGRRWRRRRDRSES